MVKGSPHKFQHVFNSRVIYLLFSLCFWCPLLWASQDALVVVDRAVIYADQEMTSPLGYIRKGKKVTIGEIPRNKAQVYPIIVSGKVAYIRSLDVSTERESMESPKLVAERFMESTERKYKTKHVVSYFSYNSQITMPETNGQLVDKDIVRWDGLGLKGELLVGKRWDIGLLANYMQGKVERETFRAVELGMSAALRVLNFERFLLRLEAQALAIPFSNYELAGQFRVNGYGASAGGGVNATYLWNENWGIEAFGGVYYTKTFGYKVPAPYKNVAPTFFGNRLGLGLNYSY